MAGWQIILALPSKGAFPPRTAMNTTKIRRAIEAKIAELQAELCKLDDVEAMESRYMHTPKATETEPPTSTTEPSSVESIDLEFAENKDFRFSIAIRTILDTLKNSPKFTRNDVLGLMRRTYPTAAIRDTSVSSYLWKLMKDKKLIVITPGGGQTATEYGWPKNESSLNLSANQNPQRPRETIPA